MDIQQFIQNFIREHGAWFYAVTFAWTFFEGETFVLFAGFAAASGLISAPLLLASAWLGSFSGDQCYFWIGRRFGLRLLERRPAWRKRVDVALGWLRRFDAGFILTFRFIYGIRNISSFALGISGIPWRRFMLLNFTAAGIWAIAFVGAGYFFGEASEKILGPQLRIAMLCVFIVFVCAIFFAVWLSHRRRDRL